MKGLDDYKKYPANKDKLVKEIKKVFNDYDNDELKDSDFQMLIGHYYQFSADEKMLGEYTMDANLNNEFNVNAATEKILGRNRSRRIEKMLSTQMSFDCEY